MASKQDQSHAGPIQAAAAGSFAGLASRFCIAPLDVIKISMQLQSKHLNAPKLDQSILYHCNGIYKEHGITGFWRGNVSASWLYVVYGGSQFMTYRLMSQALSTADMGPNYQRSFAGATAGAAGTIVSYPFDLLRTRFASQRKDRIYTGVRSAFKQIVQIEGYTGLYSGMTSALAQVVPYSGLFFLSYEGLRPVFREMKLPFGSEDALAGGVASAAVKTLVFPLDVIRKNQQVQGPVRSLFANGTVPEYLQGILATGRSMVKTEGYRGLYRGLTIGLIKASPTSALNLWFYERALNIITR